MSLIDIVYVIFLVILIIFLMVSTGIIVDKFLINSLENACKKYNLSQTTQGYLLAIGSSIPEFATNLMATLTSKSNIGIGAIFGSGAFNLTIGFGFASFFCKNNLKLSFCYFTRDIFVYLCSLFCLNIFLATKRINIYQIMTLILLWPIYIMSVNICQKDDNDYNNNNNNQNYDKQVINMRNKKNNYDEEENSLLTSSNDFTINVITNQISYSTNSKNIITKIISKSLTSFNKFYDKVSLIYSYIIPNTPNYPLICFIINIIIIFFHSNSIIIIISEISSNLEISETFLGMTIISWGDNIGDIINGCILAKNNSGDLLSTSIIGSQITNIQLSLGIPWLIHIIKERIISKKQINYIFIETNNFNPLIICSLTSSCLFYINKMQLNKTIGFLLICIYTLYLLNEFSSN